MRGRLRQPPMSLLCYLNGGGRWTKHLAEITIFRVGNEAGSVQWRQLDFQRIRVPQLHGVQRILFITTLPLSSHSRRRMWYHV